MVVRRETAAAALAAVVACGLVAMAGGVAGVDAGLLHIAPALLLGLPLLAGRYVAEERLAAIARVGARPRRRASGGRAPGGRGPHRVAVRGAQLLARSLAERGPPVGVLVP